jgi:hypothetical protein
MYTNELASIMTHTGIIHLHSIFMCDMLFMMQIYKGKESVSVTAIFM